MELTQIQEKIYEIRGQKVMLDYDLALLYQLETKRLKESVKRNIERFPEDFMFVLTKVESDSLRSQIATLKPGRGSHSKYLPYAFTEQGIAMLASILNSPKAIETNIFIVRSFVFMRRFAISHSELLQKLKDLEKKYDKQFDDVFEAINYLLKKDNLEKQIKDRKKIGYMKT
ncbi:ORF6N domain-containing protein [Crocinitomicaceae bacterium]|nr:ORF6N domain-containing protein [Crocinitomicaceae bacterium]